MEVRVCKWSHQRIRWPELIIRKPSGENRDCSQSRTLMAAGSDLRYSSSLELVEAADSCWGKVFRSSARLEIVTHTGVCSMNRQFMYAF